MSGNLITTTASTVSSVIFSNAQTGLGIQWDPQYDQIGFAIDDALGTNGEFCERKVEVRCPHCAYPNYPFRRKKKPVCIETGEEWVSLESKEPYAHYQCFCVYCDEAYVLRLFG